MAESHLNEIKIDPTTHGSGGGDDGLRSTMTEGEEISKNNPLHGQKKLEIPFEDDEDSFPPWLRQLVMQEEKEPKIRQPRGPKIPMVSTSGVRGDRECYVPSVVSIGPYHQSDRTGMLGGVEKLKAPMTRQFVEARGKNMSKKLYAEVKKVAQQARAFYDESIIKDIPDEEFMKMMFIDGCFILQFFHCIRTEEKLEMTDEQVASVKRDLFLLENQLPFPVLKSLMEVRHNRKIKGMELIYYYSLYDLNILDPDPKYPKWLPPFWVIVLSPLLIICAVGMHVYFWIKGFHLFDKISGCYHGLRIRPPNSDQPPEPQREAEEEASGEDNEPANFSQRSSSGLKNSKSIVGKDNQPAHLLQLVYSTLMGHENENSKSIDGETERQSQGSDRYLYYSAKNLKRVGIHFRPMWYGTLTDVKFKSSIFFGTLKLPQIGRHESTKSLLLNLVAYEESTSPGQFWVASYICFMDSLINDAEDVAELRSKGILVNYLRDDQEVADLFNDMGSYLKPDASTYNDVKRKINKQYGRIIPKWVAEWQQTYFGRPWTFIAFLAAACGLALTATQTYYAPCK